MTQEVVGASNPSTEEQTPEHASTNDADITDVRGLAESFAEEIWRGEFELEVTDALLDSWEMLFSKYSRCIVDNLEENEPIQQAVIPMPTGTGKSQATRYYLSKLPEGANALVVSFFTEEAIEAVATINEWYGSSKADVTHTDRPIDDLDDPEPQILFITHARYLMALADTNHLKRLTTVKKQPRQLYIIDESLSMVKSKIIKQSDAVLIESSIAKILDKIPDSLTDKQHQELSIELDYTRGIVEILNTLNDNDLLSSIGLAVDPDIKDYLIDETGKYPCFTALYSSLSWKSLSGRSDDLEAIQSALKRIKMLQTALEFYLLISDEEPSLNAISFVRVNKHHSVVLDATSNVDKSYDYRSEVNRVDLSDIPLRRYNNVNLFTSQHKYSVGYDSLKLKNFSDENLRESLVGIFNDIRWGKQERPELKGLILGKPKDVLIITHKKLKDRVQKAVALGADLSRGLNVTVDHWGNITGKNTYKDFEYLVVFGIKNLPNSAITDTHITTDRGLSAIPKDKNMSAEMTEERSAIRKGLMNAEVIQGINRVRCRSVKDTEGNCHPTSIYLFVPHQNGDQLLETIQSEMTGINIEPKDFIQIPSQLVDGQPKKMGRPNKFVEPLIEKIRSLESGPYRTKYFKDNLSIPNRTATRLFDRIQKAFEGKFDSSDPLHLLQQERNLEIHGNSHQRTIVVG